VIDLHPPGFPGGGRMVFSIGLLATVSLASGDLELSVAYEAAMQLQLHRPAPR
jgi:hypothetical protein